MNYREKMLKKVYDKIKEALKTAKEGYEIPRDAECFLFGSIVKGTFSPESKDIDVLCVTEELEGKDLQWFGDTLLYYFGREIDDKAIDLHVYNPITHEIYSSPDDFYEELHEDVPKLAEYIERLYWEGGDILPVK